MYFKPNEMSNDFLIIFYLNGRKEHVINNTSFKKYEGCINEFLEKNSTYIIEIEKNHWLSVTITENRLFYIEKRECEICSSNNSITQFADKHNLSIVRQQWDTETSDCLIYPLFFTLQMLRDKSTTDPTKLLIDLCYLNKFREEFNVCKFQFGKIKEKIEMCSDLLLETKDEMPIITDYKHALYFIYFVESIALQDVGLTNNELKRNLIQTAINEQNIEIIKKIRFWLLHREKSYFIFPHQLHKFTFQETNSRKTFGDLQKYLQYVYHKLCGEEEDEPEKQPFSILCDSEKLGNKLEDENISYSLEDLSYQFIKEGFSLKKLKNPEKTIFNYIANFIPLLRLVYKTKGETFKSLIDFRNQLIHNNYILYQNGKEVPYIACQNRLHQVKEFLLKFNFCIKVTRELKAISNTDELQKSTEKLNDCLQRFKNTFSEELKSITERDSLKDEKKELNYLIEKIEQYFRSLFIVDAFNSITLSNIEIEKFDLPPIYYRFSEENKRSMFKQFNAIKEISESKDLSDDVRKDVEEIIKHELKSSGLNESEYKRICRSVQNPQYFDNEKLIKEIQEHILNIENLKSRSEFKMNSIINDYYMYLENDPKFSFEKYKKIIDLEQFIDKAFEINIADGSFYMFLSNILKNFIPLYFNLSPNYTSFATVESIFQDKIFLDIFCCCDLDMQNIITQIYRLPLLAPLCVEILCTQKLKLGNNEENFVMELTRNLLRYENDDDFLQKLLSLKIRDKKLIEKCFDEMLKLKLIQITPKKLHIFFSFPIIQNKLLSILKSDSYECEYMPNILIAFLNYQYNSAYELHKNKKYKEALDLVDRKSAGLSLFLREVVDKNILEDEIKILKMKFLIGKIKFVNGVQEHDKQSKDAVKHFRSSRKILDAILTRISNSNFEEEVKFMWEQRIKVLKARILHFMGECEESCNEYKNIFLNLYNVNNITDPEKLRSQFLDNYGFIDPYLDYGLSGLDKWAIIGKNIKDLLKTKKYKSAIQLNIRDLNIAKILMYYSEELQCRMATLNKAEDALQCAYALSSCIFCFDIQLTILSKDHFILKKQRVTMLKLSNYTAERVFKI